MALLAYVLIRTSPGKSKSAAEAISKISGVKSAHSVTGRFDVIAVVEANDFAAVGELVIAKIQKVDGLQHTETAVAIT